MRLTGPDDWKKKPPKGLYRSLTNDDVPPIEGITWFAEYVTEDDVLEQWQIIVAGDSGDPVQGTVNIWFRANGEVDGWEPEPIAGTYNYPDVRLS